jgi:ferredoxin-NADP reductase
VLDVVQETPDVRTFRLDNRVACLTFAWPGQFCKVCITNDGEEHWRSFTISSPPTRPETIDLTIKLNPDGQVSNYLFREIEPGKTVTVKGAQGGFCFDPDKYTEPLVLVSAGSGITPMMSIARFLADSGREHDCWFLYGARTPGDIIFHDECRALAWERAWFRYHVTLSQANDAWDGCRGRLDMDQLTEFVPRPATCRYFLCGPNEFMETFRAGLQERGVPDERIHTELFHTAPRLATA